GWCRRAPTASRRSGATSPSPTATSRCHTHCSSSRSRVTGSPRSPGSATRASSRGLVCLSKFAAQFSPRETPQQANQAQRHERRTEMGRIVVSDNVSLDGVIQDPAGDEGFERGGWVGLIKDRPGAGKLALDEALATEALLLGRRSYEWMAGRWPSRS